MNNELAFKDNTEKQAVSVSQMTTKEVAEVLGVAKDTINATVERLELNGVLRRVDIKRNSQGGYLFNEQQVTMIKQELTDKVVTVKELAKELHVAEQTVKNTIYELRQVVGAVFDNIERNSQGGYLLNEKQATAIKLKLRERNNLKDNSIVSQIGNDLEFFALLKKREEEQRMLDAYRDRRIAELQAENERQAAKIKEDASLVDFAKAVTESKDCIDIGQAAKVLNVKGVGRNKLFEILREKGVLDRKNQPYQKYVDSGYFRVIETSFCLPDGTQKINLKTLVFQKGVNFIRDVVKETA